MTMPEKSPADFPALAEEFSKAARNLVDARDVQTLEALMARHTVMAKFKAETPNERMRLSEILLDCGLDIIRKCVEPKHKSNLNGPLSQLQIIFGRLTADDERPFVPERAAGDLADAALDLIRKSETIPSYDYNWSDCNAYRLSLVKMALQITGYAETLRGADKTTSFAATKTMAAPKKPMLQAGGQ